ncbi:MAG: hypothetical protein WC998_05640 [Candidatus Paceibacterota bacterium]|jgi:hypothetical protein
MGQPNLREKIYWWFVYSVVKYEEGKMLNLPLKILHFIFFPLMTIYYQIGKHNGYQWETGIWIIHDMKYSDAIFKHFAFGDGCWYRVVKREDGLVTIEKQAPK